MIKITDFASIVDKSIPIDLDDEYIPNPSDVIFDEELLLKDTGLHEVYEDGRVRVVICRPFVPGCVSIETENDDWYIVFVYDYGVSSGWGAWVFDINQKEINELGSMDDMIYEAIVGEKDILTTRGSSVATGIKKQDN